jgi:RNA polymerase sigma-70 factor (ECF subfamily)
VPSELVPSEVVGRVIAGEAGDADLLRAHAEGDPEAFGVLARRHRDRLWAVALRTLGDREEAADAVQDALLSAFRAGRSTAAWRGDSAVTTWLHRIVVNACLDRARRRAARPADPLPEHDVAALAGSRDPVGERLTQLDVTAALATLPPEQRAALVLVDMYGWGVEEAAEVLECPVGTVKSRCARGRARLLPLLRDGNRAEAADVPPPTSTSPTSPTQGGDRR